MANYTGRDQRLAYLFTNGGGGGSCKVISGYYHDGDFYEDQSYTQVITGDTECLYIDLDTTTLYLFDGTDYVEVQGGGGTGGGLAVTEEVLLSTPTTISAWLNPIAVQIDRNAHLMISVEVGLSDNPQIRNTVYNFTMEELKNNELGSHYILIPNESISEGSTTYRHALAYVCLDGSNLNIRIPDGNSITINRITAIRKTVFHTYSTTEQVVGTWIDGKPIYEKVFTNLNLNVTSANTWYRSGCFIPDIEQIITGFSLDTSGQSFPAALGIYLADAEIAYCITTLAGNSRLIGTLVVQYTKTTT